MGIGALLFNLLTYGGAAYGLGKGVYDAFTDQGSQPEKQTQRKLMATLADSASAQDVTSEIRASSKPVALELALMKYLMGNQGGIAPGEDDDLATFMQDQPDQGQLGSSPELLSSLFSQALSQRAGVPVPAQDIRNAMRPRGPQPMDVRAFGQPGMETMF